MHTTKGYTVLVAIEGHRDRGVREQVLERLVWEPLSTPRLTQLLDRLLSIARWIYGVQVEVETENRPEKQHDQL